MYMYFHYLGNILHSQREGPLIQTTWNPFILTKDALFLGCLKRPGHSGEEDMNVNISSNTLMITHA